MIRGSARKQHWGQQPTPGLTVGPQPQDSDDIRYMVGALKTLGIQLEERWEKGEMLVKVGEGGRGRCFQQLAVGTSCTCS